MKNGTGGGFGACRARPDGVKNFAAACKLAGSTGASSIISYFCKSPAAPQVQEGFGVIGGMLLLWGPPMVVGGVWGWGVTPGDAGMG